MSVSNITRDKTKQVVAQKPVCDTFNRLECYNCDHFTVEQSQHLLDTLSKVVPPELNTPELRYTMHQLNVSIQDDLGPDSKEERGKMIDEVLKKTYNHAFLGNRESLGELCERLNVPKDLVLEWNKFQFNSLSQRKIGEVAILLEPVPPMKSILNFYIEPTENIITRRYAASDCGLTVKVGGCEGGEFTAFIEGVETRTFQTKDEAIKYARDYVTRHLNKTLYESIVTRYSLMGFRGSLAACA